MNRIEQFTPPLALDQASSNAASQRHRITFATEKTLAYVSVLDLASIWERSLRRGAIPLRYSQGFNPRPKMNFAAPLPVGCGSKADLLDIWLEKALHSAAIFSALQQRTPVDLHVIDVVPVSMDEPALAEQLKSAEYLVRLQGVTREELTVKIEHMLAADSFLLPRRGKKHRGKTYDLRSLILDLRVTSDSMGMHSLTTVWMHLKAQPGATGRPDEVLKAWGLIDCLLRCSRSRLILAQFDGI